MSDIRLESGKKSIKTHFMDYGYIDVLSTSQGRPAADATFGVTYRTIWGRPEDVRTFFGDMLRTSSGRNFAELEGIVSKFCLKLGKFKKIN